MITINNQANQLINDNLAEIARLTNALVSGEKIENIFYGVFADADQYLTASEIAECINGRLMSIAHLAAGR